MRKIKNMFKKFMYLLRKDIILSLSARIDKATILEGNNKIRKNTDVRGSNIGRGTYISEDCIFPRIKIGRFCSIAPRVKVVVGNHPTRDFVSTHPSFFSTRKQAGFTFVTENKFKELNLIEDKYFATIGNDVWIGSDVIILAGVNIGDGAVIGSGAVVSKNIEPYSICVGNPIKEIRKRFTDEQIKKLLQIKWWGKDMEWIESRASNFDNIDKFLKGITK